MAEIVQAKADARTAKSQVTAVQSKYDASSSHLEHMTQTADAAEADLLAAHTKNAALQAELDALGTKHQDLQAALQKARNGLQGLQHLQPQLAKATQDAQACHHDMDALSGTQAKALASMQEEQQRQRQLQERLDAADQQLSSVTQDYVVCQDVSLVMQMQQQRVQVW